MPIAAISLRQFNVPLLFSDTYNFIEQTILPLFDWPEFGVMFEEYRTRRAETHAASIDVFPAMVCMAAGGDWPQAVRLTASWTLYVLAARLFDDLQDNEAEAAQWQVAKMQKLPSFGLFAVAAAQEALSHLSYRQTQQDVAQAFNRVLALAAKGQGKRPFPHDPTIDHYFATIAAKTGLVFATAAWAGGRVSATAPDKALLDGLYQYGLMMDQIVDDCQDIVIDLTNQTWTLPLLYALSQTTEKDNGRFHILLKQPEKTAVWADELTIVLTEMGAIHWSLKIAESYQCHALAVLGELSGVYKEPLEGYAKKQYPLTS